MSASPARGKRRRLYPLAVDAKRLGQLLTVSERTIRTWDGLGIIPAPNRIGGKVVWSVPEVREWLAAGSPDRATWNAMRAAKKR